VAAASYEARKYGVHSAMPSRIAKQRCPHLIFVKPRFEVYKAVSQQIRDIFDRYTPLAMPFKTILPKFTPRVPWMEIGKSR
jgi:DNA polymerase IV